MVLLAATASVFANIPGGGNGTGANVTLVNNGDGTVTMANGIVTAQIKIATAQRLQLTYLGVQVTSGGTDGNSGKMNSVNNVWLDTGRGINRAAIRSTFKPGSITLTATRAGLESAEVKVNVLPGATD